MTNGSGTQGSVDTSFVGRGRETAVPERGLPFDVSRRTGLAQGAGAGDGAVGTVAEVFSRWSWLSGAAASAPAKKRQEAMDPYDLRQPSKRFFERFPWHGSSAKTPAPPAALSGDGSDR